jgi:glycosyltransferase involved in cell wall biosynthesis
MSPERTHLHSRKVIMAEYADWNSVFKIGSHYICEDFLKRGFRVLWFQSYWNLLTPFVAWRGFRNLWKLWRLSPLKLREDMVGFAPFTFLPYRNFPLARGMLFGSNALRFALPPLPWWLERNGWRTVDLLWITSADLVTLPRMVDYSGLVYRITDNMVGFSHVPTGFLKLEEEILKRAHVVLATSRAVAQRARMLNRNTHYIANAVDLASYQKAKSGPFLLGIPRPRIVYVGSLEYWVDYELLYGTAKLRPEYNFVLVGPPPLKLSSQYGKLKEQGNIHLLGAISPSEIPSLLKSADAALIPFRLNSLTHNVSPLKLYEYLAAGLPVVSTPLEEVRACEAPVIFADSTHDFAKGLDNALALGKNRSEFIDFASENTWEKRLHQIEDILAAKGIQGFSG